jgi:hypothetical protein
LKHISTILMWIPKFHTGKGIPKNR